MTPKQVQRRLRTIQKGITSWYDKLGDLRTKHCEHPDVTKKYEGSTGNYDPSADSYWIRWRCPDCEHTWVTDQSRKNILAPGREIK